MEYLKELYEAWGARVKSNVLGSTIVAFIFVNWKALFFIAFADVRVVTKFNYFDANTSLVTLALLPVLIGFTLSLGLPFINDWAHRVVSEPVSRVRSRDDEFSHRRLKKKNAWAEERNREQEIYANKLLKQAQIEQEIDSTIHDQEKRENLKRSLDEFQKDSEMHGRSSVSPKGAKSRSLLHLTSEMEPFEKLIIVALGVQSEAPLTTGQLVDITGFLERVRAIKEHVTKQRLRVDSEAALQNLRKLDVVSYTDGRWSLTTEGYVIFDMLQKKETD
ncbi:MAG: type IV secretion system protein [Pseudopelagicola sp.]|nr:type IV secretion system protein [Pseudopelagicola sp.]